jgi:hypothetical protein
MVERHRWDGAPLAEAELLDWIRAANGVKPRPSPALLSHVTCRWIISHFLGEEWFPRYAGVDSPASSYFHPHFRQDTGKAAEYTARLFSLAECLFNLQRVRCFHACIDNLVKAQIESAVAELQIGMMLFQDRIEFQYIDPRTTLGRACDLEILIRDKRVVADVKCNYEIRQYSRNLVANTLDGARKQIPRGRAGIVFVKVPQAWSKQFGAEVRLPVELIRQTGEFMARTSRVVKVVYYLFHLEFMADGGMMNRHAVSELPSPRLAEDSLWNEPFFPLGPQARWDRIGVLIERALA